MEGVRRLCLDFPGELHDADHDSLDGNIRCETWSTILEQDNEPSCLRIQCFRIQKEKRLYENPIGLLAKGIIVLEVG